MKRKLIGTLILTMLVTASVILPQGKAYADTIVNPVSITEENHSDYTEVNRRIKDKAKALCDIYGAASVQYAISDGDNIITSDNVVNTDKHKEDEGKMSKNTMYGIGSVSKMFTTAAVMKLVDEGKIDLDMPLINYIPEFEMKIDKDDKEQKDYRLITPRMLLNHSSGLMGSHYNNMCLMGESDTTYNKKLLSDLKDEGLKAKPGEFSVYCNDGFTLAEILVEKVINKGIPEGAPEYMSFSKYVSENISKHLGLNGTKTPFDDFDRNILAKTYSFEENREDPKENFLAVGAGGMYSNAEDLCKFQRAITRKDGKGILSENAMKAMETNEAVKGVWVTDGEDNILDFGLGWDSVKLFPFNRYGIKAVSKGGDSYAYHCEIISLPDLGINISVITSGADSMKDLAFANYALLEILKCKDIIKEDKSKIYDNWHLNFSEALPENLLEKYDGIYNYKNGLYDVKITKDGILTLKELSLNQVGYYKHTNSGYFIKMKKDGDKLVIDDKANLGIRFVDEKNGETYIEEKQYKNYDAYGTLPKALYIAQKISLSNTNEACEAWKDKNRLGQYLLVNQKYSYWYNNKNLTSLLAGFIEPYNDYFQGYHIKDINTAECNVKIPGLAGRDCFNIKFSGDDNTDIKLEFKYVNYGDYKYISLKSIQCISKDIKEVKIDDNGYAKWFLISGDLNGKTMTVHSSKKSSVNVYNCADGKCLFNSYLENYNKEDNSSSIELDQGKIICFVGEKGETFNISIN